MTKVTDHQDNSITFQEFRVSELNIIDIEKRIESLKGSLVKAKEYHKEVSKKVFDECEQLGHFFGDEERFDKPMTRQVKTPEYREWLDYDRPRGFALFDGITHKTEHYTELRFKKTCENCGHIAERLPKIEYV